jgi:hypothetical protein
MNDLIEAIVEDDASAAKRLIRAEAGLARRAFLRPKLYQSGILHWIYGGGKKGSN